MIDPSRTIVKNLTKYQGSVLDDEFMYMLQMVCLSIYDLGLKMRIIASSVFPPPIVAIIYSF
jgi:hypothetical protein